MTKCGSYSGSMSKGIVTRSPKKKYRMVMTTSDVSSAPQCSQLSSRDAGEEDEPHVEVDLLEEGVDLVQPERVDAHVERSGDGEHRTRREKPDPEPQLEREAARLGVLSEQHFDPVYRAEEHDREHEVRVVHLRVRDVPEGGETDVGREHGAHEDEHGPRHVKELRGVHGFSGGGACGPIGGAGSRAADAHDLRASHGRERTGPRSGRSGWGVPPGSAYCGYVTGTLPMRASQTPSSLKARMAPGWAFSSVSPSSIILSVMIAPSALSLRISPAYL